MSKNILIISPFFYPEPISTGKFNTDIAVALRDNGHKVTVLCSHPIYPKWIVEKSDIQIQGISIIRGGANIKYSKRIILRRAVLELWYSFYIIKSISKFRSKTDIIIPVFPPSLAYFFIFRFLKKGTKKIGMVHDLQEVYSKGKKGILNKFISIIINKIEATTFKSCDKLIFLSSEMKEAAQSFYKLNNKKLVVQYPFSTFIKENNTNDLGEILPSDKIHIVYSGALGEKQNPKGLLDFFIYASQKMPNTCFHFFSQGQIFEELKKMNKRVNILFHDLVPRENIEELYRRSSVQIIPQLPGTAKGSLPSKLPNLLASGCNILFITDEKSEIEILFDTYHINKAVSTWDNEVLLNALQELLTNDIVNLRHIKLAKKLFSLDSMTKKILND